MIYRYFFRQSFNYHLTTQSIYLGIWIGILTMCMDNLCEYFLFDRKIRCMYISKLSINELHYYYFSLFQSQEWKKSFFVQWILRVHVLELVQLLPPIAWRDSG
jgi:hypothetical protein